MVAAPGEKPQASKAAGAGAAGSRRGGRPTFEQAAQLDSRVRAAALELFLERGYEGTTLDAIAHEADTTKASLYTRYSDKAALFSSVVRWATSRSDWPAPEPPLPDQNDLKGSLSAIADAALHRALHPDMIKLTRIAAAEAERFPDLAQRANAVGWPRRAMVVELLERHATAGAIVADDHEILAELFLGLVSGVPARMASFGVVRDEAAQRRQTRAAVELFVRGLRPG